MTVSMIRAVWAVGGGANAVVSIIENNGGVCPSGANNQDYYSLPGIGNGNCEIADNYGTADGSVMFNCLGKFDTVERLCFCNSGDFVAPAAVEQATEIEPLTVTQASEVEQAPEVEQVLEIETLTFVNEFVMGTAGQSCEDVCTGRDQICNVDTTVSMIRAAWATGGDANAVVSIIEKNGGVCPNGANNQDYYSLPGIGNGNCEIADNYGTAGRI
ncbi:hypothetical protein SARC_18003, partial [Sphaeroforma arctica JP610]